ncbi:hypothetical protein [Lyngbya sp. CCY1209]|uniref:hypothetical protein n=1 Tax=Lyngbya sp. CCY1209 TaxID=2886103 RepID=UPI002D200DEA|nr:hypothetical protein [Lyngbya sp. CCY1209]MEB3886147.1 hypothetical protein [Lyngbya sp. CCY1209]
MARFGMFGGLLLVGASSGQLLTLLLRASAIGGWLYFGIVAIALLSLSLGVAHPDRLGGLFATSPLIFKLGAIALTATAAIGLLWGIF